jgi:chaperonin GroEL (HSP60 family)
MGVARNICLDPRLVPGGGAVEMAVSRALTGGHLCNLKKLVLNMHAL